MPDKAQEAFQCLGSVLESCGLQESVEKSCMPNTIMIFLGLLYDTVNLTVSIDSERLNETERLILTWMTKESAGLREVQSLVGKVNFIASCVRPGRVFISRLLNFLRAFEGDEKARLLIPGEFKGDLRWWQTFLPRFNSISMIPWNDWEPPDHSFALDACLIGCGALTKEYFHKEFPHFILQDKLHIIELELLTVVVALKLWARKSWENRRIVINCDNQTSV